MPGRNADLELKVSQRMGARAEFAYPDGTDVSQARAELRVHALDSLGADSVWWATNLEPSIRIETGPPPKVVIDVQDQSADRFGRIYGESVPEGRYGYALDLWLGAQQDPDYRIQGAWINEAASGEILPNQQVERNQIRFGDFHVTLELPGAVVNTGPVTGMTELADDPNPRLAGSLKSAGNDIVFDADGTATTEYARMTHGAAQASYVAAAGVPMALGSPEALTLQGGSVAFSWPTADGPAGQAFTTDGAGGIVLAWPQVVQDTAPVLGGNLTTADNDIRFTNETAELVGLITTDLDKLNIGSTGAGNSLAITSSADVSLVSAGDTFIESLKMPKTVAPSAGDALVDLGGGAVGYATKIGAVADDPAPVLSGPLDTGGNSFTGAVTIAGGSFSCAPIAQFAGRIDVGARGQLSDDGARFKLAAVSGGIEINAGAALYWPTAAGTPGQLMSLDTDGVSLVMIDPPATGLQQLQDDPDPGLGGDLRTRGNALLGDAGVGVIFNAGLDSLTMPAGRGTEGHFLSLGPGGQFVYSAGTGSGLNSVSEDPNPALGGPMDTAGSEIFNSVGGVQINQGANSLTFPTGRGTEGHFLQLAANGQFVFAAAAGSGGLTKIEDDSDPTLGSILHTNSYAVELGPKGSPIGSLDDTGSTVVLQNTNTGTGGVILRQQRVGGDFEIQFTQTDLVLDSGAPIKWFKSAGGDQNCAVYDAINQQMIFSPRLASVQQDEEPTLGGNLNFGSFAMVGAVRAAGSSFTVDSTARFNADLDIGTVGQLHSPQAGQFELLATGGAQLILNAGSPHRWPPVAGTVGHSVVLSAAGELGFASKLGAVSEDPAPLLSGPLDTAGNPITGSTITLSGGPVTVATAATFQSNVDIGTAGRLRASGTDLLFEPLGAGQLYLAGSEGIVNAHAWPATRGNVGQVPAVAANGVDLEFVDQAAGGGLLEDETDPKLGADLKTEGNEILINEVGNGIQRGSIGETSGQFVITSSNASGLQVLSTGAATFGGATVTTLRSDVGQLTLNAGDPINWPQADGQDGWVLATNGTGIGSMRNHHQRAGWVNVTRIDEEILAANPTVKNFDNQSSGGQPAQDNSTSFNALAKLGYRMYFPPGEYVFEGLLDPAFALLEIDNNSVELCGPGKGGPYASSQLDESATLIYNGPPSGIFLSCRAAGLTIRNLEFYGRALSAPETNRCGVGIQIARVEGQGIGGQGKAGVIDCGVEKCDVGIQMGDPSSGFAGDHVRIEDCFFTDNRIDIQNTRAQNVNQYFARNTHVSTDEVMYNLIEGGQIAINKPSINASPGANGGVIFLRLEGRNGGTSSGNGMIRVRDIEQDGQATNVIWLDDRIGLDGAGTSAHMIIFEGGLFDDGATHHLRISGKGVLLLHGNFQSIMFTGAIYAQGNDISGNDRNCLVVCNATSTSDVASNLLAAGSGYCRLEARGCWGQSQRVVADETYRTLEDTAPSNQAAWNAIVDAIYDSSANGFQQGGGAHV